jgi:hypothetical protein
MSVLALPFVGPDPAISERAQQVRSLFDDRGSALTVSARRRWALDDAWCAASAPNWDGYGAMPLSAPVLRAADLFLSAIRRHGRIRRSAQILMVRSRSSGLAGRTGCSP